MKRFLIALLVISFLLIPSQASAHVRGIPIMKINGKDTQVYPVQTVRTGVFGLPDDADGATENYLVNLELTFKIDTSKLPTPQEIWANTDLIWNFGDGTPTQRFKDGVENKHIYTKMGTYVMNITADYRTAGFDLDPQVIQTTVINVLPSKDYQLPQAIITINGEKSPSTKSFSPDFLNAVSFDGSNAIAPSSKVVAYKWDFEDGQKSEEKKTSHTYQLPRNYATILLRVTDANGFFTDEYATLSNSGKNDPNERTFRFIIMIAGIVLFLTLVIAVSSLVYKRMKKRKKT